MNSLGEYNVISELWLKAFKVKRLLSMLEATIQMQWDTRKKGEK